MLCYAAFTGISAAGVWLTHAIRILPCMRQSWVQCNTHPGLYVLQVLALLEMQMRHTRSEHANTCTYAAQQQTRPSARPFPAPRSSYNLLQHTAHLSRQVVCSISRPTAQHTLQERRCRRELHRQDRGRDAAWIACAASPGNAEVTNAGNTKAPSPLRKFVQDQFLPLALLTAMIVG